MRKYLPALKRVGETTGIGAIVGFGIVMLLRVDIGHGLSLLAGACIFAILTGIAALIAAVGLQLLAAVGKPLNGWQSAVVGGVELLIIAALKAGYTEGLLGTIMLFAFGAGIGWAHYHIGVRQQSAAIQE